MFGQLRWLKKMEKSKAEFVRYIAAGAMTTLVNIGLYTVLLLAGVKYYTANLAAIVLAKIFAYFINKTYVYHSRCENFKELTNEVLKFVAARGGTGVLDYVLVVLLVEMLGVAPLLAKYFVMLAVILLNYALGKWFVFKKKGTAK